MKNYFILLFAVLCTTIISAQSKNITNTKHSKNKIFFTDTSGSGGDVGLLTPTKDTLFIEDSDIGHKINELWENDRKNKSYQGKILEIIMVKDFKSLVQRRKKTIVYDN